MEMFEIQQQTIEVIFETKIEGRISNRTPAVAFIPEVHGADRTAD
jgi:hypothetical protein